MAPGCDQQMALHSMHETQFLVHNLKTTHLSCCRVSTSLNSSQGLTIAPTMASEVYTVTSDFTPEASDQVKLTEGGSVSVLVKKDTGWWVVKTEDDNQGWVPATHLHSQLKGRDDEVVKYPKGMGM